MERNDKNNIKLKDTDIIDIGQTVNGQSQFIILTLEPLDIRYANDANRRYEYDKEDLLAPFMGEPTFEIIGKHNPN